MAPRVSSTERRPTHHISLSDGTTTIGLILSNANGQADIRGMRRFPIPATTIRQGSGVPTYDDRQPPFLAYVQDNWAGGIGNKEFNADGTRYRSGENIDTTRGKVMLGPARQAQTGIGDGTSQATGTYDNQTLTNNAGQLWASPITAAAALEIQSVTLKILAGRGTTLYISLKNDNAGEPGDTVIASNSKATAGTAELSSAGGGIDLTETITIPLAATLSPGTTYWLTVTYNVSTTGYIGTALDGADIIKLWNTTTSAWDSASTTSIIYFAVNTNPIGELRFFEYKGSLYAVTRTENGGAPSVYRNGISGAAASNSTDLSKTNVAAAVTLVADFHIGDVIKITNGAGEAEEINWRVIIDNDTDSFTVSPNWTIAQDGTTEYAVLGQDYWYEITGHGLTKPVTDVLVVDGIVYFAQGEATAMRRFKAEASAGAWVETWAADGTNKAHHLELLVNANGRYIYKTLPSAAQVDKSVVQAWGTDLVFAGAIIAGSASRRITNIIPYGESGELYVLKEDEVGRIDTSDDYIPLPISEMRNVASSRNGQAALFHGVYLYFSMLDGYLERYYDSRLDDIGPNRDEGLPETNAGAIAHLVGFPGRFYAAVDAGKSGYSSVMCNNGSGWHPIYVSPNQGRRINQLHIQPIPGDPDTFRLWVAEETGAFWLPTSINPEKDTAYEYATSGHVISAWFYGGMKEVRKHWHDLKAFAEDLSATYSVTLYYQTDVDTTWTEVGEYNTSPVESQDLSLTNDVTGRRWRYKLVLAGDGDDTPKVEALVVSVVERLASNQGYKIRFVVSDDRRDLDDENSQTLTAKQIIQQLETWADSDNQPEPLVLRSMNDLFDDMYVYIEPASVAVLSQAEETNYIAEITVMEG